MQRMRDRIRALQRAACQLHARARCALARAVAGSLPLRLLARYPPGRRILTDSLFREGVALRLGLLISALYGGAQCVVALLERSVWLGALACYHMLLAGIRFCLIRSIRVRGIGRDERAEWRRYRLCGVLLLLMTPVFAGILVVIVRRGSHVEYPGFLIYFAAVYAFGRIGVAASSVRKCRRYGSPVLRAAKDVSLMAAMVSVLSLEIAVLSRYGSMQRPAFYQGVIGTMGGAICVCVLGRAIGMVVQASGRLKRPKEPSP
ncbi:MAG: hypothetical protein ACI4O7_10385 [Aristaeellaceae bacterium]